MVGVVLRQDHIYVAQALSKLSLKPRLYSDSWFSCLCLLYLDYKSHHHVQSQLLSRCFCSGGCFWACLLLHTATFSPTHACLFLSVLFLKTPFPLPGSTLCAYLFPPPRFTFHQNSWQTVSLVLFSSSWSHDKVLRTKAEGKS